MNLRYIDEMALRIYMKTIPENAVIDLSEDDWRLYRIYAVLAFAKGLQTTSRDVHDAWSAWMAAITPNHRSLVKFEKLTPAIQAYDDEYRDAIHSVVLAAA